MAEQVMSLVGSFASVLCIRCRAQEPFWKEKKKSDAIVTEANTQEETILIIHEKMTIQLLFIMANCC